MMRSFASADAWSEDAITLDASETHHLLKVLRARPGDRVHVLDGRGREAETLLQAGGSQAVLAIEAICEHPPPPVQVTLAQGVIKGQRMDLLLQKTAELGVASIVPLACDHAVVKMDGKRADKQYARWSRILLNAVKQSGNPWLPRLEAPVSVAEYVQRAAPLRLYGALGREAEPLAAVVERSLEGVPGPQVDIAIGPEGDFSEAEYESLRTSGAVAVDLGGCILRSETAALYVISVVHAKCYAAC